MQEDDEYQIDFEALKVEMQTCKETLLEKVGLLSSLDLKFARLLESFPSRFHST
jgi:hypothetical protein